MSFRLGIAFSLGLVAAASCRTNFDSECEAGKIGCACFENGTCTDGLTCSGDICVDLGTETGDEAGTQAEEEGEESSSADTSTTNSEAEAEAESGDGDGDGDSTGDGDGDTSGDGDGDTSGDGDGDGDGDSSGDGDGDGDTGGDGDGDSGGDGDGDSTGDGDGDGDGDPLFPAHGIDIETVEANQGVGISIGLGGLAVPAGSRESRLIGGRETLIRVHHSVHGDWIQREIEAQLEIVRQDQSVEIYTTRRMIFADSVVGDLSSGFSWVLDCDAAECDPGTDFRVTFWDVGAAGPQTEGVNASPTNLPSPVGFENLVLEMRMVFFPMHYQPEDTTPDLNTAWMDGIADWVYQMTPTTSVTYEVRDPPIEIVDPISTTPFASLAATAPTVQAAYNADFPQDNDYYIGVIDTLITPEPFAVALLGSGNINVINYNASPLTFATNVVHEAGHCQGMLHVDCAGAMQQNPDANFPTHPAGTLETGGWGVLDGIYRAPDSTFDYMTYCAPVWSSAFHWSVSLANLEAENTQP